MVVIVNTVSVFAMGLINADPPSRANAPDTILPNARLNPSSDDSSVQFSRRRLLTSSSSERSSSGHLYVLSSAVTKTLNVRLLRRMRRISWPRRAVERLLLNLFWRLYCPRCERITGWQPSYNKARTEEDFCLVELGCRRCNLVCRDGFLPQSIARRKLLWYERH